jgi:hypothetical protein
MPKDIVYIDYWPCLPWSLVWLVAEKYLSEGGMAGLIVGGFKKGCDSLIYSSTDFKSTLAV